MNLNECNEDEMGALFSCFEGYLVCVPSTNRMKIRMYFVDYSTPKPKYQMLIYVTFCPKE